MNCPNCNAPNNDTSAFCLNCGARLAAPQPMPQPMQQMPMPQPMPQAAGVQYQATQTMLPPNMDKRTFYKQGVPASVRSNIIGAGVLGYIISGIFVVQAVMAFLSSSYLYDSTAMGLLILLDAAIYLGLSLGVHLGKSRVCAILMAAYTVFAIVMNFVNTGSFSGYIQIVASICAIMATFKFQKMWKDYRKQNGMIG